MFEYVYIRCNYTSACGCFCSILFISFLVSDFFSAKEQRENILDFLDYTFYSIFFSGGYNDVNTFLDLRLCKNTDLGLVLVCAPVH